MMLFLDQKVKRMVKVVRTFGAVENLELKCPKILFRPIEGEIIVGLLHMHFCCQYMYQLGFGGLGYS